MGHTTPYLEYAGCQLGCRGSWDQSTRTISSVNAVIWLGCRGLEPRYLRTSDFRQCRLSTSVNAPAWIRWLQHFSKSLLWISQYDKLPSKESIESLKMISVIGTRSMGPCSHLCGGIAGFVFDFFEVRTDTGSQYKCRTTRARALGRGGFDKFFRERRRSTYVMSPLTRSTSKFHSPMKRPKNATVP